MNAGRIHPTHTKPSMTMIIQHQLNSLTGHMGGTEVVVGMPFAAELYNNDL